MLLVGKMGILCSPRFYTLPKEHMKNKSLGSSDLGHPRSNVYSPK